MDGEADPSLERGRLVNEATRLLRQIHPSFLKLGRPTSAAFKPTPKDEHALSVYDGDMIAPAAAYAHYRGMGHESAGVMAVTVAECAGLELPTRSDPEPFPEHAVIDFQGLGASQREKKSKKLRDFAVSRGWSHESE